ncbi:hypothetical protein CNEO2_130063 [Clostridium neonatale]|nr:hypothetical protein CNEO2_130063 [Clostridium neonatale]CAI3238717.1 hypothetical protein CNEO2_270063 [Clostridium neonatale]
MRIEEYRNIKIDKNIYIVNLTHMYFLNKRFIVDARVDLLA